jgi:hypothetical protein
VSPFLDARRLGLLLSGLAALLLACPKPQTRGKEGVGLALEFRDSLQLPSQAIGMSPERDGLLIADIAGSNIYRTDFDLRFKPAIALPSRIAGLQAVAADPFFVYLFDQTRFYRLDRSSNRASQLGSNIRGTSPILLGSGELAFIDAYSGHVLILDPTGGITDYNAQRDGFQPSALVFGRDGNFYFLNQARQEVAVLNRVGNLVRRLPLPGPSRKLGVDDSLNVYLLDQTGTEIAQVNPKGVVARVGAEELGLRFVATDMVVNHQWLFLLIDGQRILKFQLP